MGTRGNRREGKDSVCVVGRVGKGGGKLTLRERNILAPKLEKKGHRILWQETDLPQLQVSLPSGKEKPNLK